MNPNGIEALMNFLNSDIGQLLKNIVVNEVVPFAKQRFINGAMNPAAMTAEEQAQRASEEFATVDIPGDDTAEDAVVTPIDDIDSNTY